MELYSESLVLSGPQFPHMEWSVGLNLDRVGKLFPFCFSIILISSGTSFMWVRQVLSVSETLLHHPFFLFCFFKKRQ